MPQIIPIKDLKNTGCVSELCHKTNEPVFITKNGYGDMVIMSMETYEKNMLMQDVLQKLNAAEEDIAAGRTVEAETALQAIRKKHGV